MAMRVLIVGDDPLARAGLAALLALEPDVTVTGQAPALPAALDAEMETAAPDVILWDLGWEPSTTALAGLAEMEEAGARILALTPDASLAPEAWGLGALGVLHRDAAAKPLAAALRAVEQDLVVASRGLAPAASAAGPSNGGAADPAGLAHALPTGEALTPRETEVLALLAQGLPNKSIAQRLGISEHTVKFHVNAIMGKLGAQSRTEAAVLATRLGLMPL